MTLPLVLVAAVARNGVIGGAQPAVVAAAERPQALQGADDGQAARHGAEDFSRSAGRLPGPRDHRPHPGQGIFRAEGARVAHSLRRRSRLPPSGPPRWRAEAVVIAGGGELYAQTHPPRLPPRHHRSRRSSRKETSAFRRSTRKSGERFRAETGVRGPRDEADFVFVEYERLHESGSRAEHRQ